MSFSGSASNSDGMAVAMLAGAAVGFLVNVLPALCAIHAGLRPDSAWREAGQSKANWVLVLLACTFAPLGFIGAGVYWFRVRPKLKSMSPSAGG